jgi:nucleoside-diphosphate-sugar epimerase
LSLANSSKQIIVTGATGFVGRFLCPRLLEDGFSVRAAMRSAGAAASLVAGVEPTTIESIGPETEWCHAMKGIDTVIHLAARVHVMSDPSSDPLADFRRVNVQGTENLAWQAARAGVKRLVFVSSVKVNGEENSAAYTTDSPVNPTDPYGISKWEAEQALRKIGQETGMEVVVVRPTLVYGPGVKANFLAMLSMIMKGIPLPLASINNKRSLIYVGNLVDALATCAVHPSAAGKTYLVSDGEDVSTPELIRRTARALGVPARLFPVPASVMRFAGAITGKRAPVNRLLGSLTVDSSRIRSELGWKPPFTMEEGLRETAEWYKKQIRDTR